MRFTASAFELKSIYHHLMKTLMNAAQFNFADHWNFKILPLRKRPRISQGFRRLQESYEERVQWKFDEIDSAMLASQDLAELMEMRLILDLHIARVKCFDLGWLQENFQASQLAPLSLAIAEELFPEEQWIIFQDGTEEAVVTNTAMTIVFDLKNSCTLAGQASLVSAGDSYTVRNDYDLLAPTQEFSIQPVRHLSLVASAPEDDLL